jgi:hypothetical protein
MNSVIEQNPPAPSVCGRASPVQVIEIRRSYNIAMRVTQFNPEYSPSSAALSDIRDQ